MIPDTITTIMPAGPPEAVPAPAELAALEAESISAWFGDRKGLDRLSPYMPAGSVTALMGLSGCGKSTLLRALNRIHELISSATLAGSRWKLTDGRRTIGMVFQKPRVTAGLELTGSRIHPRVRPQWRDSRRRRTPPLRHLRRLRPTLPVMTSPVAEPKTALPLWSRPASPPGGQYGLRRRGEHQGWRHGQNIWSPGHLISSSLSNGVGDRFPDPILRRK